ncbi:hypothetical protein ABZS52_17615 [Micromonospora profundi]|uniref:hypothetical protein n=1 Tax=Micromonospora TaxID=1873 RepID=UPI0012F8A041|nr:hypothetical protein [Micromonospora sp. NRRL B-16802]
MYRLEVPIETDSLGMSATLFGQQARDGYLTETGKGVSLNLEAGKSQELDASFLRDLAATAAGFLGEGYEMLRAADERGMKSSTPPPRRHRLVELISYAEHASELLSRAGAPERVELSADYLCELRATTTAFDRWRHHPAWPHLVATLGTATEGQHSVMMLTLASYLVDADNGVGILADNATSGRIADLWLEPSVKKRLELEVKTPLMLRGPISAPLIDSDAEGMVTRLLKKSAGQLNRDHDGVLAIGGFHLGPGTLERIVDAGTRVLGRMVHRKAKLAALVVAEIGAALTEAVDSSGATSVSLSAAVKTRVVQHPGYRGDLNLRDQ